MAAIEIWTDGSGTVADLPAGWGAVLVCGEHRRELSGHLPRGTNNVAELSAVIGALSALKGTGHQVTLYSDSQYVLGHVQGRSKVKANRELVERLRKLARQHTIKAVWVRGHNGDPNNERCDALANAARLAQGELI